MTTQMIEKFIDDRQNNTVNIHFKDRGTVRGIFIRTTDYSELKYKNLWRIVIHAKVEEWNKTKNMDLSRIFNGISFTRLSDDE